jgi:hypothetical protein
LALTPQTDEAFLREVDEELRRDQMARVLRRYGMLLLALIVIGLAAFAGYLWWKADREKKAGLAGEDLTAAFTALSEARPAEADAKLKPLAEGDQQSYRALAQLTLAARKVESGDAKAASAAYMEIASDTAIAQPLRDAALIRATAAAFDTLAPKTVIDRLAPLAVPGSPWYGTAAEMTAIAWIKLNQPQKAAAIFGQIAKDPQVPQTLKARAVRISGALDAGPTAAPAAVAEPQKDKSE